MFCQTRSAIILYDTLPAYCIPKAFMMGIGEVILGKVFASHRPLSMILLKDYWMQELGSEVAGHDERSQQTQPKTPNPTVRTGIGEVSENMSAEAPTIFASRQKGEEGQVQNLSCGQCTSWQPPARCCVAIPGTFSRRFLSAYSPRVEYARRVSGPHSRTATGPCSFGCKVLLCRH